MKLTTLLLTLTMALFVGACNDHDPNGSGDDCVDCGDSNTNNTNNVVPTDDVEVEMLSPQKTAFWAEMVDGYNYGLARNRTSSDPDLFGHQIVLPDGPFVLMVTGENQLIVMSNGSFEVHEAYNESHVGELIRNYYKDEDNLDCYEGEYLPLSWTPDLFPTNYDKTVGMEILTSAFIKAKGLSLHSYGFKDGFPSSEFHVVGETSYYEWNNLGHAKYVFIIKR